MSFSKLKDYASLPAQLCHGHYNEGKGHNIHAADRLHYTNSWTSCQSFISMAWCFTRCCSHWSISIFSWNAGNQVSLCSSTIHSWGSHQWFKPFTEMYDGKVTLKCNNKHFIRYRDKCHWLNYNGVIFMIYTFESHTKKEYNLILNFGTQLRSSWQNFTLTISYLRHVIVRSHDAAHVTVWLSLNFVDNYSEHL